ncbi:MAG: TFIIB-type zinc ribbon-containing protein [Ruminococcus sp.]|nr:TFIIB-type zinc ribbon-containing protein [Ruminococcus sp.]
MATVNYKCPNCGGPLKFNPELQKFSCDFCASTFAEKEVQQLYAEKEAKQSQAERAEQRQKEQQAQRQREYADFEEQAVVYTCPSCGAEVVTTSSTAATHCFYCQNPVVLGGRLSGEFKPDKVVPFALTKENAIQEFLAMCKKKWFLPKDFASEKQFEKLTGVYFPYWYVDSQRNATMTARCKKIRSWSSGNKRYTETKIFQVARGGDIDIYNVFERALKSEDRDMLQCVHPYDMSQARDFSMSYLSGFQAEKRDIEISEIQQTVDKRIHEYCKQLLKESMNGYDSVSPEQYTATTNNESWKYNLLPVWVVTYKYKGQIYPFAINGQTGKTYGMLPTSKHKLAALFAIVAAIVIIFGTIGGLMII